MNTQPPFPAPPGGPLKNGLGIASLVLGLLSIVTCFFTGLPAIITGHIARSRAQRYPDIYGGRGAALAGLILGYLSLPLTLVWLAVIGAVIAPALAVALPELARAKGRAQSVSCVNNLKQVGLAARIWSNEHNEIFPPSFASMSNELVKTTLLVCPQDKTKKPAANFTELSPAQNVSYEYLTPNAKEPDVAAQVVFRCPIHGNTVLGDGSVQEKNGKR
jgi:competence protein ComGC